MEKYEKSESKKEMEIIWMLRSADPREGRAHLLQQRRTSPSCGVELSLVDGLVEAEVGRLVTEDDDV